MWGRCWDLEGRRACLLDGLSGVVSENAVQVALVVHDLLGLDLDIHGLARRTCTRGKVHQLSRRRVIRLREGCGDVAVLGIWRASERLVDHDARVRHGHALPLRSGAEEESPHGRSQPEAHGRDVASAHLRAGTTVVSNVCQLSRGKPEPTASRASHLHGVVDAHARSDRAARRVDEKLDILRTPQPGHGLERRAPPGRHALDAMLQKRPLDGRIGFYLGGVLCVEVEELAHDGVRGKVVHLTVRGVAALSVVLEGRAPPRKRPSRHSAWPRHLE